jgi:glutathione S-transferase
MDLALHGYRFSVYLRIVRMALELKALRYRSVEVDPFVRPIPADYLALHPFGRVPVLVHEDFVLYETAAITRYIDEQFSGIKLQPDNARARARMQQIISILDNYGYWPMIRQVFAHRVFRPSQKEPSDQAEIEAGRKGADLALRSLEDIAAEIRLDPLSSPTLAGIHLAAMMAYFVSAPEGAAALEVYPKLSRWWEAASTWSVLHATDPGLP